MAKSEDQKIKLRVVESLQDDAYKGIARIDSSLMKKLKLQRGDIVSIKGGKESFVIVDRSYPADEGTGIVRIDGIARKNSKTGIGEFVEVDRADLKEAKKVMVAPAQQGIMVQGNPDAIKQNLLGRPVMKGDILVMGGGRKKKDLFSDEMGDFGDFFGDIFSQFGMGVPGVGQMRFAIVSTSPSQPVIITENTEITLNPKAVEITEDMNIPQITYEDIGGLTDEVKKVREMVELPLKHPEIFARLGIDPPKGVLLHGPPGTGKTLLARAVANETGATFIEFNTAEVTSALHGQTEKNIQKIFEDAEKMAPTIIFIDEIDAIAFKREDRGANDFLNTPVMALLKHMDGLKSRGNVIVIGATNRPEAIDTALRRPGRFDREIEVGIPDRKSRLQILKIHTRGMPLTEEVDLEELSSVTHGFVGADISSLCKESAMAVLRRVLPDWTIKKDEGIPEEIISQLDVRKEDFEEALKTVRPSAMREIILEVPDVTWDDIGGLKNVKIDLKEAVETPLKNPDAFKRMGVRPPKGILLYGPPGTGKTALAKAIANESDANFISIKGPELVSKWVGESAKGIRKVFHKARQVSPCIIFFDEIDSIAQKRRADSSGSSGEHDSILNQLLTEMDGLEELKEVVVIGATNRPDLLDAALLRPGRFDRIVYVSIPDKESRLKIFQIHTKSMPLKGVDLVELSEKTEGYTGADIEALCREAAMLALRENIEIKFIEKKHFENAMGKILPSVSKTTEENYKQIEQKYLKNAKSALPNSVGYAG
jgi:transitional endoplasmic reticulum ATPase